MKVKKIQEKFKIKFEAWKENQKTNILKKFYQLEQNSKKKNLCLKNCKKNLDIILELDKNYFG